MTAPDTVTILCARGRRLAKLVHPHGRVDSYDAARTVTMHPVAVADLDAVAGLLVRLLHRPDGSSGL